MIRNKEVVIRKDITWPNSRAECWADIWHPRHSMRLDGEVPGGTVVDCMAAELQEPTPAFGGHAAKLSRVGVAVWRSCFE